MPTAETEIDPQFSEQELLEWDTIIDLKKIIVPILGITAASVVVGTGVKSGVAALETIVGAAALWVAGLSVPLNMGIAASAAAAGTATIMGPLLAAKAATVIMGKSPAPLAIENSMANNAAWASFCAAVGAVEIGVRGPEVLAIAGAAGLGVPATLVLLGFAAAGCTITLVGGSVVVNGGAALIKGASNKMSQFFNPSTPAPNVELKNEMKSEPQNI